VAKNRDRVGQYLRGTSYPEPYNLWKIAGALGVPLDYLAFEYLDLSTDPPTIVSPHPQRHRRKTGTEPETKR
jgi:transcriptional regulator with XRE-family HTH domain